MEKWEEQREINCNTGGGRKRERKEKVDLGSFRREENYAEFFDEGTVVPIQEFLEGKGVDISRLNSEAKMRKLAEEEMCMGKRPFGTCDVMNTYSSHRDVHSTFRNDMILFRFRFR